MNIQECVEGMRVVDKEKGKTATIKRVDLNRGEVDLEFDNGSTARAHPKMLRPASAEEAAVSDAPRVPMRPCPNCATKMPIEETTCSSCGFQYGVRKARKRSNAVIYLLIIAVAVIIYAVWRYMTAGQAP